MAEKDRYIKSGQFTLPRLLFLALIGALIVGMVALGGIFLTIGYWVITLAICVSLYLVAIDYGVKMDKVDLTAQPAEQAAGLETATTSTATRAAEVRPRRRSARPAKRRR